MIRFSAGLVAVAIGVLIGGIATSKLLLVYIAIVLSAVALVALAIGVALKREELFGETHRFGETQGTTQGTATQGTVRAQAGASPVVPARSSDKEAQNRPNGHVTPAPPREAAAGQGAAFTGTGQAPPSQSRGAWENRPGDVSRPSSATASSFPATRHAAAPFGAPAVGEPPAPWGAAAQGRGTAPRSPGAPTPSAFASRTPSTSATASGAGPDADLPDWFSRSGKAANAGGSPAPGTGAAWSRANADTTVPGDKEAVEQGKPADAPAPADDDWPGRYSWLDDKPAESDDTSDARQAGTVEAGTVEAGTVEAGTVEADTVEAGQEGAAPEHGFLVARVDAEPQDVVVPDVSASPEAPDAGSHLAAPAEADESAKPRSVRDLAAGAPAAGAAEPAVPGKPEGGPTAATATADDSGLVIVVSGVPRFHQQDCVLVRFMSDDETEKLSVAQAKEAGCTPCAACQPG